MKPIPLFAIDDLVMLHNESSANPEAEEIFVGKIEAIHSRTGRKSTYCPNKGETRPARIKPRFAYTICRMNLTNISETALLPYKKGTPILPLTEFKRELNRWHAWFRRPK
jgi:hypothetical protein